MTNEKCQMPKWKMLESSIEPLGHWIPPLVQDKAEELAAGLLDRSLRIQNFVTPGLAGFDHDRNAIHTRTKHRSFRGELERTAIDQDVVEADAQGIDRIQSGVDLFALFGDPHQIRSLWQRLNVFILFGCGA